MARNQDQDILEVHALEDMADQIEEIPETIEEAEEDMETEVGKTVMVVVADGKL
jgi:hypothetical protein